MTLKQEIVFIWNMLLCSFSYFRTQLAVALFLVGQAKRQQYRMLFMLLLLKAKYGSYFHDKWQQQHQQSFLVDKDVANVY